MKSTSLIELLEAALSIDLKKVFAEKDKELANMFKRIDLLKAAGDVVKANIETMMQDGSQTGKLDPKIERLRKLYSQVGYALQTASDAEKDLKSVSSGIHTKLDDTEGVFLNLFRSVKEVIAVPKEQPSYRGAASPPPLPEPADSKAYELVPITYKAETYHIPKEEAEAYTALKKHRVSIRVEKNHVVSMYVEQASFSSLPPEFSKFSFLNNLRVGWCGLKNLISIPNPVQLRTLFLAGNRFSSLNGLENISNLYELDVGSCGNLKDISALEKMKSIRKVCICDSDVDYDNPENIRIIQGLLKRGVEVQR
jgi:hypothetical protein